MMSAKHLRIYSPIQVKHKQGSLSHGSVCWKTEIMLLFLCGGVGMAGHTLLNKSRVASSKTQSFNCMSLEVRD